MTDTPPTTPLTFLAEKGIGILALLFALSYAFVRPAYENFYYPLGLQPEDVGLNQVVMISRVAAVFFFIYDLCCRTAPAGPFHLSRDAKPYEAANYHYSL